MWKLYGFLCMVSCLPYQFEYLLFLFLVWLLWKRLPILCWREVVRAGILVLFQILAGRLWAFTVEYYIGCGFVINSFYYVEICSLYSHFRKGFYHEWMLNFVKCFFCIYWDDHHMVFVFCCCGVSQWWFAYVELSMWPWNESTCSYF